MRYLKIYEDFYNQDDEWIKNRKSSIDNSINWDLIQDAKDMALDYIDDGYTLDIQVIGFNGVVIYESIFNHSRDDSKYVSNFLNVDLSRINYYIMLYNKNGGVDDAQRVKIQSLYLSELGYRLNFAYPDERINMLSQPKYRTHLLESVSDNEESYIDNLINWDLIQDIEYMSLDYIDAGYTLDIHLTDDKDHDLFNLVFNHGGSEGSYLIDNNFHIGEIDKISYYITLINNDIEDENNSIIELVDRLRSSYPDELIYGVYDNYDDMDLPETLTESVSDNIIEDCKDILLELSDVGFKVEVRYSKPDLHIIYPQIDYILVKINNNKNFTYKDIKEYIERLKDYLGSDGWIVDKYRFEPGEWVNNRGEPMFIPPSYFIRFKNKNAIDIDWVVK